MLLCLSAWLGRAEVTGTRGGRWVPVTSLMAGRCADVRPVAACRRSPCWPRALLAERSDSHNETTNHVLTQEAARNGRRCRGSSKGGACPAGPGQGLGRPGPVLRCHRQVLPRRRIARRALSGWPLVSAPWCSSAWMAGSSNICPVRAIRDRSVTRK